MIAGVSKVPVFADKARAIELTVVACGLIAGGAIAWWTVQDTAAQAGEAAKANTKRIEAMKDSIVDLKIGQVKLESKVESDGERTRDDLARQQTSLERIIDQLNRIAPAAGGSNR